MSNLASVMAVGVALLPTARDAEGATDGAKTVALLHLLFAGVLFTLLAVFSLFLFTKTDNPQSMTAPKQRRNQVYRACGAIIVVAIVLVVVTEIAHEPKSWHALFWLESIAVVAFGAAWLVKGEFFGLLADP